MLLLLKINQKLSKKHFLSVLVPIFLTNASLNILCNYYNKIILLCLDTLLIIMTIKNIDTVLFFNLL